MINLERRNPFGIAEHEEYFDELFTSSWSIEMRQPFNQTNALAWLDKWQEENPPWWYVTVIDGHICADGEPEELEKHSTYSVQARDRKEAALKLWEGKNHLTGIEDFIKGPFDTLEQARKT